ncbi:MAG: UbiX family flavin prenyltransferase [Chloroflexi bacterium]|nr:UbiX family flavin prenyltransferase [Chloroflexota bacterium]
MKKQRLVVGISGSSGAILGIRLLEALKPTPVETHLIITPSARLTIAQETDWSPDEVLALADRHYSYRDLAAPIASGSFRTDGMVVIPCSIKSLSSIANSYSADLLTRAADVTLKEGRKLVLIVRETPLHAGHIRLMELASQAGAILFPPIPAFYARPGSLDEMINNIVGRVLDRLGIENDLYKEWAGIVTAKKNRTDGQNEADAHQTMNELWSVPSMTLATTGADGMPHAAPVYFAADQNRQNLYFFSAKDSQHSRDVAGNPRAAVSIHPQVDSWQEIRGLQMRGEVHLVTEDAAWQAAWENYLVKFPFTSGLKDVIAQNALYTFRPQWIRLIDNRREFGYKEEWNPA